MEKKVLKKNKESFYKWVLVAKPRPSQHQREAVRTSFQFFPYNLAEGDGWPALFNHFALPGFLFCSSCCALGLISAGSFHGAPSSLACS